ncbi:MAG: hypothetical protein Q9166_004582 [cf. Caloplaca sp. 2 TL-2023]
MAGLAFSRAAQGSETTTAPIDLTLPESTEAIRRPKVRLPAHYAPQSPVGNPGIAAHIQHIRSTPKRATPSNTPISATTAADVGSTGAEHAEATVGSLEVASPLHRSADGNPESKAYVERVKRFGMRVIPPTEPSTAKSAAPIISTAPESARAIVNGPSASRGYLPGSFPDCTDESDHGVFNDFLKWYDMKAKTGKSARVPEKGALRERLAEVTKEMEKLKEDYERKHPCTHFEADKKQQNLEGGNDQQEQAADDDWIIVKETKELFVIVDNKTTRQKGG